MVNENAINSFFEAIAQDTDFAAKVVQTIEPNQIVALAGAKGVELTNEDVMASRDILSGLMEKQNNGELSEEDLENVAGGLVVTATATALIACTAIGVIGTLAGAAIGGAGTILGGVISAKGWKW